MNNNFFDNLNNTENSELDTEDIIPGVDIEFDKRIEKQVKKLMLKAALKSVLAVLAVLLVIFCMISPIMNISYPNPAKANKELEDEPSVLLRTLSTFIETAKPGADIIGVNVSKKGFGNYEASFNTCSELEAITVGKYDTTAFMKHGVWTVENDPHTVLSTQLGLFYDEANIEYYDKNDDIKILSQYPESTEFLVNVFSAKYVEVASLMEELDNSKISAPDDLKLVWVRFDTNNDAVFHGGISLEKKLGLGDSWIRRRSMNAEELKAAYIENLKYLKDNISLLNGFNLGEGNRIFQLSEQTIEEAINDVEGTNVFRTKAYTISGGRDKIIEFLKSHEDIYITVTKTRLGPLSY